MKPNTGSVPSLLQILWNEGFFNTAKSLAEVSREFGVKGYHPQGSSLAVALMRAVRMGGFLARVNRSGQWKYIQKHPISSVPGRRIELFNRYDFHSLIKEVALQQFENSDFKGAILNAFIEVVNQVKVKAGRPKDKKGKDVDGDDLMNKTFGCDGQEPQIRFNDLKDGLDRAEQRGLMYLFKGIVGVRDKKAHLNFVQNDP